MHKDDSPPSGFVIKVVFSFILTVNRDALFESSATSTGWTKVNAVPEPTSGLLLLLGVVGLAFRRRRA